LEKVLDDNLLDVDTLWSVASSVQGEVFTARGGRTSLHGRLVDMTTSTSAAQSTANSAQSTANTALSTANTAKSGADQANDRITDARGSYGSLSGRLNAMTTATSNAQSDANSVQS